MPKISLENADYDRHCSACGATSFTTVGTRADGLRVIGCDACGLGVVEKIPTDLDAFYGDAYYGGDGKTAEIGYSEYETIAAHGVVWAAAFVNLLRPAGRLLDIGCVDGSLLKRVRPAFERFGIEVNPAMAARAAADGVTIVGYDLFDEQVSVTYGRTFDVVTSIAVFEHLGDFRRGFQAALDLMRDDGVLLFEVPLISDTFDNSVWFNSSLEHVYYPTSSALHHLIEVELGHHLIGGELNVQDYASTFVGIVTKQPDQVTALKELYDRLSSESVVLQSEEEQAARFLFLSVHGAHTSEAALTGLDALAKTGPVGPAMLKRFQQLWSSDLRRLRATRQERQSLSLGFDSQVAEVQRLDTAQRNLVIELEQKRSDKEELERQLGQRSAEKAQLQLHIDSISTSTSWRLTKPLRAVVTRFPKQSQLARRALRWGYRKIVAAPTSAE